MSLPNRTILLFQGYIDNTASDTEQQELLDSLNQADQEGKLDDVLQELWLQLDVKQAVLADDEKDRMLQSILRKEEGIVRTINWRKIVSIAALLILIVAGYVLWVSRKSDVKREKIEVATTHDVAAPSNTRAVITLADGSKVYLDNASSGTLAIQEHINVERSADGKVIYQPTNGIATKLVYNTLTNPRGSKVIDMQLSDGSHVWLNAGSSVTYPVAFVGNERKVQITGEAYFEVAHDANHPFIVSKGDVSVEVLGTHFNVNAYDDEDALRVTLLEGSVKVSSNNTSVTIKPNEQAIRSNASLTINRSPNIEAVMAWKNGLFRFDRADINTVLKQIARWYDVDIEFHREVNQHFGGTISREVSASKVFEMLEMTGGVKFKIEGKKVIVNP